MKTKRPKRVLAIDVGGSHVKFRVSGRREIRRVETGPKFTARDMVAAVNGNTADWDYDLISIGFPGPVLHGKIFAEPPNLGGGWVGFDFHKALRRPTRVLNDAAMQAVGSYHGGRMLFLGLGTGLGSALIIDGVVEPMEIADLPYKKGRSFESYVGESGRIRLGAKKWRKSVADVVEQLAAALEVDYVVLGGGNAQRLKALPKKAQLGDNDNAFVGGFRVWRDATRRAAQRKAGRARGRRR